MKWRSFVFDGLALAGAVLVGVGLGMFDGRLAVCWVGSLLLAAGLKGALR